MANKILQTPLDGTPPQISFADHSGDFSPTAANTIESGTPTDVQLTLASLGNGSYRQSAKFNFGSKYAAKYRARLAIELAATPTAGQLITVWLAGSDSSTAANGNAGGVSGSDAAYTGYSSNAANSIKQLQLISVFVVTAQATGTVQVLDGWEFPVSHQYGSIVLLNSSGVAIHSDDVECNLVFDPVIPEIQ